MSHDIAKVELPQPEIHLMARSAEEIQAANLSLLSWVDQRIAFALNDVEVLTTNLDHARRQKWSVKSIQAQLAKAKTTLLYYEKIKAALNAGYTIIPNLPLNLFAVRVREGSAVKSNDKITSSKWEDSDRLGNVSSGALKIGEGQHVSSEADRRIATFKETVGDKEYQKYHFFNDPHFKDIEFPVALVKPEVMTATQAAMSLRIFDQVGIVDGRTRKGDPVIVGQIVGPKAGYRDRKTISFLIAWFIDARSI